MRNVLQDIRYAFRGFRKSPAFTTVAILSLALGIGANSAIFSLVDQLILKPLPVRDPQSLVLLAGRGRHYGSNNGRNALSYPMYQDFRDRNAVFSGMMCRYGFGVTVSIGSQSEVAGGELVSGNYFSVLGIGAAMGRVFTAADDLHPDAHPYAVLSYAYWQSRFGGDPNVLGHTIRVDNYPLTIVGVARKGFDGLEPGIPTQIFIPIMMTPSVRPGFTDMFNRRSRWVNVFGRLKPGMSMKQAQAGLQPLFHQILDMEVLKPAFRNASPTARREFLRMYVEVMPGSQGNTFLRRQYETPLLVLMGIVALVLLIACANLASLLTARAAARRKEIAIRLSMGSSRARLIRQLLTESLILSIAGGAAGIGLAVLMVKSLLAWLPVSITGYNISSAPDSRALAFTFALALLSGIAFGLAPALQATRPDVAPTLKDSAGDSAGAVQIGFRKLLVAFQVTLSLVLLIGAGVFIRSLTNLRDLNPGFRTANLLTFQIRPEGLGYDPARMRTLYRQLDERLNALPGVRSAGIANINILANNEWDMWVAVEGRGFRPGDVPDPHFNAVSPRYFDTMGMHILNGRAFTTRDDNTAPNVAIVNAKFARKYFPGGLATGKHIGIGGDPNTKTDIQIVGIVNDAHYENLREQIPEQVFLCNSQGWWTWGGIIYVQTERDPRGMFGSVRSVVHDLDPNLPVQNMKTFDRQLGDSLITERLTATLATVFGVLATALVLIGLYGVMSFMVTRRSLEIGIRMAVGALAGDVVWAVMREALLLIAAGLLIGLPVAYALTRVVRAQLYGIEPGDPASIALATSLLVCVTALAGFIPARRAAAFDPWRILRHE